MKNIIVVLSGGLSGERKISLLTGKACFNALKKRGYKVKNIDAKGFFIEDLKKIKPKIVFNALHGKYGEDGFIQSILESLKIPYTHSGVIASSLAMDKELSRNIFKRNHLRVPKSFILQKDLEGNTRKKIQKNRIKFPVVIKPINEGSSLGVHICNNFNNFKSKYNKLKKKYDRIYVEEYIPGKEIQVAVKGGKSIGAIELRPKRKFYDYKAKYKKSAKTLHIMPAEIIKKKYEEVKKISELANRILKCKGITRCDFRFHNNKFFLLEVNTQPGMTSLSLVPEIAKYHKISFVQLVEWMVKNSGINR